MGGGGGGTKRFEVVLTLELEVFTILKWVGGRKRFPSPFAAMAEAADCMNAAPDECSQKSYSRTNCCISCKNQPF